MSYLGSFIGGAAQTGADILKQDRMDEADLNKRKSLADYQEELEARRQRTVEEIKAKRLKEQGEQIQALSDQTRMDRISGLINSIHGAQTTPADVADIANNPAAMKAYGLIDRPSVVGQEAGDRAAAAIKIGAHDSAREYQGQQQIENAAERNRITDEHNISREAHQDKVLENQMAWQKSQAASSNRRADSADERAERAMEAAALRDQRLDDDSKRKGWQILLKDVTEAKRDINVDPKTLARLDAEAQSYRREIAALGGKTTPADGAPPDGTRGVLNGVAGVVMGGAFVPDKELPKATPKATANEPKEAASSNAYKPGLLGQGRAALNPDTGTLPAQARVERAKQLRPTIEAKLKNGYDLTPEESAIAAKFGIGGRQ